MRCPLCQLDIPAEDIDLGQRLAKCRGCDQVIAAGEPLNHAVSDDQDPLGEFPARPEKIHLVDEGGQGYMQWRWFHPMAFGLLFFCIVWDSFLIFWYWAALLGMGNGPAAFNLLAIIFPIAHVAVGVGLTYFTLCLFLNKTQIIYDGHFLSIRSGPIPVWGNRGMAREEIRGLESGARTQVARGGGSNFNYPLFVVLSDKVRKPLVSYSNDSALIRYVQRQLETWLRLPAGRCFF